MGNVLNSKWFIDPNARLINDVYTSRLGVHPSELEAKHMNDPAVTRAMMELRAYHLPPYFDIPTKLKGRLCSQSGPGYNFENNASVVERELINQGSGFFYSRRQHPPCTICGARRASKDGVCYKCVATTQGDERKLSKLFNALNSKQTYSQYWDTPKKLLLAQVIGCRKCKVKLEETNIWFSEPTNWKDGLCPECISEGYEWSLPQSNLAATPLESYPCCQVCGESHMDYAIWGMCETCYSEWQDQYLDPLTLFKFVEQFGSLAALLIRPSAAWPTFLKTALAYTLKGRGTFPTGEIELVPFTLKEKTVTLNLKEMIYGNSKPGKTRKG